MPKHQEASSCDVISTGVLLSDCSSHGLVNTYRCTMWPTQRRHRWRRRRSAPLITTNCWMSWRGRVLDYCAHACVIFHALTLEAVCVGSLSVLMLFMLHAAASSILVLLTFGQPTFKVLFNLSKCCQGSEQHLNNIVAGNIFPSVQWEDWRQLTIYGSLHQ